MSEVLNNYLDYGYNVDNDIDILDYNLNRDKDRKILERNYIKKLDKVLEDNLEIINSNIELNKLISQDIPKLEYKINTIVEKLKGAILVERNTTSTIYSTLVPITQQYTNKITTTATVKDNVIFGISDTRIEEDDLTILSLNDIFFKNLNIKRINKNKLKDVTISNLTHNTLPFDFTININKTVSTNNLLIIDLKDFAILEIYKNNNLHKEKTLSNYFSIPIDTDTDSITIRSYPTMHKSTDLNINVLGITDLIYQEDTIFETKDIAITESLSKLVLDTCDNTFDENINIDYFISINNKEYEKINTTRSFSNKNNTIQSIISLSKDSELTLLGLQGEKKSEGNIIYILPDNVQNNINFEVDVYLQNINKLELNTLYLLIKEDIYLHKTLITLDNLYLDSKEVFDDIVLIPKGIRLIESASNFNYEYLENILGNENIFSLKLTKPILKRNGYKYVSLNSIDLLNAYNTIDINEIYIKDIKKEIYINTIKLKAILSSIDKKTVPYISRFLIRGI